MSEPASTVPAADPRPLVENRLLKLVPVVLVLWPYGLLLVISLGSGWTFPGLLPDRLDLAAWRHFASDRDNMAVAVATSAGLSLIVGTASTFGGLLAGRAIRRTRFRFWRFLVYLPFVISPVIVGICLYDLLIRLRLAGTIAGVVLLQSMFALSFATVFFSEFWSPRAERLEQLVRNLGGNDWAVWRHAVFPQARGLILICFLQTALSSWLDYGLVSVVGGGHVPSVTIRLFAYIREASVNQAALASLILLAPALAGFFLTAFVYSCRRDRTGVPMIGS